MKLLHNVLLISVLEVYYHAFWIALRAIDKPGYNLSTIYYLLLDATDYIEGLQFDIAKRINTSLMHYECIYW